MTDVTLFFDTETNSIDNFTTLGGLEIVHCLSVYSPATGSVITFSGDGIPDGLEMLEKADTIVGHNVIGFDLPVLRQTYGWRAETKILDTLIIGRCVHSDLRALDMRNKKMPNNYWGSHSLRAWGTRLGFAKGAYGMEEEDFDTYCEEMKDYCERDVLVTFKLFEYLAGLSPDIAMLSHEHNFARIIRHQELRGFKFNEEEALGLTKTLTLRRAEIRDELQELFPPEVSEMKTPSGWEVEVGDGRFFHAPTKTALKEQLKEEGLKQAWVNDAVKLGNKKKYLPFNPGSRGQIAKRLHEKYGWLPDQRTPDGRPKIDEAILTATKFPEAAVLCEYLMVTKRLGQIAEGKEAWLKVVVNGRIHGKVNTNGAVTGRCTHSGPNLAQVPGVRAPYGEECRALFEAGEGYALVGVDASGLELRCLAHYLALWDGGEYAKFLLEDDIHAINQKAAGLETRDQAKTFIYAFLYGAGDAKIGDIVGGTAKQGAALKKRFLSQIPALERLKKGVEDKAKKTGVLIGLDGRLLPVRHEHAALNTLLQSAGAVAMKVALIALTRELQGLEWKHGREWAFVANVHDEFQAEVRSDKVELYGKMACDALTKAGKLLKMRCPLDGEYKVGASWAETH